MKTEALNIVPTIQVDVKTTKNRGFTPEELAEMCSEKIISISEDANPIIRDQAKAFRKRMTKILEHYLRQAIRSDRTTVYNILNEAGQKDLAEIIRRI